MVMRIGIKALLFVALMGCTRGSRPAGCFVGHDGPIITATFSPDGSYLASNLLATTPSIVPGYVDLRTGYFSRSRRIVLGSPGRSHPPFIRPPVSPDLRYFIDYDLNLWRVNL